MSELKTKKTNASVQDFLDAITDNGQRADAKTICAMMSEASGETPAMWGESMVGFGLYSYRYASGQSGDWPRLAFSPRKQNLTIYLIPGYELTDMKELLAKLGKHSTGKSCLYIKRLADIDLKVLRQLIDRSLTKMEELYPSK